MSEPVKPEPERISERQSGMIIAALTERGAGGPCPRCRNANFGIEPGFALLSVQTTLKGLVLGGASIPTAVTYCNRCGYVALHALGTLGLIDNPEFDSAADGPAPKTEPFSGPNEVGETP